MNINNPHKLDYDEAMEELVADGVETILKNGNVVEFMADVKQKDHKAWEKLKEWFKNLADFLREMVTAYSSYSAQSKEGKMVEDFSKKLLGQIERIWAEGALEAGENYQNAQDAIDEKFGSKDCDDGTMFSERKTFTKGQNAKGEFTANVLVDLADNDSKWWTGRYNHAILSMSNKDDTEFRQFHQEIEKRTKDMEEYGEADNQIVEDAFIVQDGKGNKFIYRVALDGYMHGVVVAKINLARYKSYVKKYGRSNNHGRTPANTIRRVGNARTNLGSNGSGGSWSQRTNGNSGPGGVAGTSPQSHNAGNDSRGKSADQKVPEVTTNDANAQRVKTEAKYSIRDTESVSNRSLLVNAFESVVTNDIEKKKLQEYKDQVALLDEQEQKLRELNAQIKDLSFGKGPRDKAKISALRDEAVKTANRIAIYDKRIFGLEAATPLQNILKIERDIVRKRERQKGKEALAEQRSAMEAKQKETIERWNKSRKAAEANARERHGRTVLRHKIRGVVGELKEYTFLQRLRFLHFEGNCRHAVRFCKGMIMYQKIGRLCFAVYLFASLLFVFVFHYATIISWLSVAIFLCIDLPSFAISWVLSRPLLFGRFKEHSFEKYHNTDNHESLF